MSDKDTSTSGENNFPAKMKGRNDRIKAVISYFLVLIIFTLILRKTDSQQILHNLKSIDTGFIGYYLLLSVFSHIIFPAYKWMMTIRFMGTPITLGESFITTVGCLPVKHVTPFKAGGILQAWYLRNEYGMSITEGIGSVVFDRFMNMTVLILLALVFGLTLLEKTATALVMSGIIAVIVVFYGGKVIAGIAAEVNPYLGKKAEKISNGVESLSAAFIIIKPINKIILMFLAFIQEFATLLSVYIALRLYGVEAPLFYVIGLSPILILATNLPFTVSGLGIREGVIMTLFAAFGTEEQLLCAGFTISLIDKIVLSIICLPVMKKYLSIVFDGNK